MAGGATPRALKMRLLRGPRRRRRSSEVSPPPLFEWEFMARHVLSFSPGLSRSSVALCRGEIRRIKGGKTITPLPFLCAAVKGKASSSWRGFFPSVGLFSLSDSSSTSFSSPSIRSRLLLPARRRRRRREEKRHCGKTEAKMKVSFEGKSHFGRGVSKSPNVFAMKREKKGHELHPVIRIS